MTFWNRIEQYIKRNHMRWLQLLFGKKPIQPNLVNFTEIQRILVIRQHDMLGDFLLATPVFRALREHFPNAHIGVVVRRYFAEAAEMNPYIDEVLVFEEVGTNWTLRTFRQFWKKLRSGWELAIVLNTVSHSLTSDLLSAFSKAKWVLGSSHRVFPGTDGNFFYNLIAPYWDGDRHQSERNLDIVRHIGVDTQDPSEVLKVDENLLEKAQEILENLGLRDESLLIGMHVGAGKMFNRWPIIRFAELAQKLHDEYDAQIILFWGPKEQDLADQFQNYVQFQPMLVEPTSLKELAAFFALCDAMVCNDTGVMHLAAAAGVPLVAIFGPTDPAEWKPLGDEFIALRGKRDKTDSVRVRHVLEALGTLLDEDMSAEDDDDDEPGDEDIPPSEEAQDQPAETGPVAEKDTPVPQAPFVKKSGPDRIEVLKNIETNTELDLSIFQTAVREKPQAPQKTENAVDSEQKPPAPPEVRESAGDAPRGGAEHAGSGGQVEETAVPDSAPETAAKDEQLETTESDVPQLSQTYIDEAWQSATCERDNTEFLAEPEPDDEPATPDSGLSPASEESLLSTSEIEKIEMELNQLAEQEERASDAPAPQETPVSGSEGEPEDAAQSLSERPADVPVAEEENDAPVQAIEESGGSITGTEPFADADPHSEPERDLSDTPAAESSEFAPGSAEEEPEHPLEDLQETVHTGEAETPEHVGDPTGLTESAEQDTLSVAAAGSDAVIEESPAPETESEAVTGEFPPAPDSETGMAIPEEDIETVAAGSDGDSEVPAEQTEQEEDSAHVPEPLASEPADAVEEPAPVSGRDEDTGEAAQTEKEMDGHAAEDSAGAAAIMEDELSALEQEVSAHVPEPPASEPAEAVEEPAPVSGRGEDAGEAEQTEKEMDEHAAEDSAGVAAITEDELSALEQEAQRLLVDGADEPEPADETVPPQDAETEADEPAQEETTVVTPRELGNGSVLSEESAVSVPDDDRDPAAPGAETAGTAAESDSAEDGQDEEPEGVFSPFDISDDVLSRYMEELEELERLSEEEKRKQE